MKDGGIAGIVLPSSILSNTGLYTKSREIILQNFEIIAITELGSNTFMATGTNTVILFLKRRPNKYHSINLRKQIDNLMTSLNDVTINGVEHPVAKYVTHVWEGITKEDYFSLLRKTPNEEVQKHEISKEYRKKIKAKTETAFWDTVLEKEAEKLFYFVLTYPQQVVLVNTGTKDDEKRFLGYEFSNRRGSEGIHSMQRGKTIDECTQLYNVDDSHDPTKASTYIYEAFCNDYSRAIDSSLQKNVRRVSLVDMLTFDRVDFEKNISTAVKKKVRFESRWELVRIGDVAQINYGTRIVKQTESGTIYPVYGGGGETFKANSFNREDTYVISRFGMSSKCMRFVNGKFF